MKLLLLLAVTATSLSAAPSPIALHTRSRLAAATAHPKQPANKAVHWEAGRTALIICDMWDDHWCKSAARRVGEMAGPLNDMVNAARARGVFIIHAPSTCTGFYDGTPQRKRAQSARFSQTPI